MSRLDEIVFGRLPPLASQRDSKTWKMVYGKWRKRKHMKGPFESLRAITAELRGLIEGWR